MIELEEVLGQNQDLISLQNLVDIYFALVMTEGDWSIIDSRITEILENYWHDRDGIAVSTSETAMKLFKAYEMTDTENLDKFDRIQKLVCRWCHMFSH